MGTSENGVLVGRDDFLFLAGGGHAVLEIVSGTRPVDPGSLDRFRANLRRRAAWAARREIPYLHLVFPDKQSIVPELWPFEPCLRLGDLYLDRWAEHDPPVFYPVDLLRAVGRTALSRVDTHVTPIGSIHVAAELVARRTRGAGDALTRRMRAATSTRERRTGDLGGKLDPPVGALDPVFASPLPGPFLSNGFEGGNNGLVDIRFNPDAPHRKRCVFFGDSFGRDICFYLQFWFSEVVFFRSGFFHEEVAARCAPDVLITENVERYLDDCHDDADAPDFAHYMTRKASHAPPQAAFTAAFAAILSPRNAAAPPAGPSGTAGIPVANRPSPVGDEVEIEPSRLIPRLMPDFLADQSAAGIAWRQSDVQDIHSTLFAARSDILLFGPSIHASGQNWWCESRAFGEQFVDMVDADPFRNTFPGPKPRIGLEGGTRTIDFRPIAGEIERLDEPLFLATPLEPHNWGRWISTVVCKVAHFRRHGAGRRLFCVASLPWQRDLLARLGVAERELLPHDPGRTYRCRDLASVEYNVTNMTVSAAERQRFQELRSESRARVRTRDRLSRFGDRIFVSRLGLSARHPHYRVLQNEAAFADALRGIGYDVIEPETLSFDQQVAAFGNARTVVCLGGAAIYNAVFCDPGALVVSVESSDYFLGPHGNLLSSLGLRHGIVVGTQDPDDPTPIHKRWTIDVERTVALLRTLEG